MSGTADYDGYFPKYKNKSQIFQKHFKIFYYSLKISPYTTPHIKCTHIYFPKY